MKFYNEKEGRVMTADEFNKAMITKYNRKSFRGLELTNSHDNAMGDISAVDLAYSYATDRLTYIRSRYVEQTFYEVAPADFFNVLVGEGAFSGQIITNLSIKTAGGFAAGKIDTGNNNSKIAVADAQVLPAYTKVQNWALATEYTIFDVNQALFTGTWDPIEAKQKSRKKDFDLGIQEIAFLGDPSDAYGFPGLLTSKMVNINASGRISQAISTFSTTQFSAFIAAVMGDYLTNCNYTAMPNIFTIPTDDWAGLAVPVSATFPVVSMLEYLQKAFAAIVPGGVELKPLAYGVPANNKAAINIGTGSHVYMLYKNDIDTLFQEIPVNYTITQVGTYNNFSFQDVAYCQYTGVTILKPLEVFEYTY
jgi:hypothetical protein